MAPSHQVLSILNSSKPDGAVGSQKSKTQKERQKNLNKQTIRRNPKGILGRGKTRHRKNLTTSHGASVGVPELPVTLLSNSESKEVCYMLYVICYRLCYKLYVIGYVICYRLCYMLYVMLYVIGCMLYVVCYMLYVI